MNHIPSEFAPICDDLGVSVSEGMRGMVAVRQVCPASIDVWAHPLVIQSMRPEVMGTAFGGDRIDHQALRDRARAVTEAHTQYLLLTSGHDATADAARGVAAPIGAATDDEPGGPC